MNPSHRKFHKVNNSSLSVVFTVVDRGALFVRTIVLYVVHVAHY